jgi:hypothetical protein
MEIHRASSLREAEEMMTEGKDPIVVRANEHEVYVFFHDGEVEGNIQAGNNWNSGFSAGDNGYGLYVYTRLDEDQLVQHLQDPTQFQGTE